MDDQERHGHKILSLLDEVLDEESTASAARGPGKPNSRPRVLIADDNDDYRGIVSYLLSAAGCDVIEARNGRLALELALATPPDLILLDLAMPALNGYELFGELRTRVDTRHVPVVVVTGASNRNQLRDVMDGVSGFLCKPADNRELLTAVRRVLGERVTLEPPQDQAASAPEAEPEDLTVEGLEQEEPLGQEPPPDEAADDSPIIAQVNRILAQAVQKGASDIHIEPFEKELLVRFRVNGSLVKACALPASAAGRLAARVKVMSNLLLTERRRPQDGRLRAKIAGKKVELRVSTLPSVFGEKVVMRVLGGAQVKERLDLLGFEPRDLDRVAQALQSPHGLILVTGPTGSGKSTTLYTMIRSTATPDVNVVTVEDPVEAELPGITQTAVRPELGVTFETALRAFLRQDPDVMLVGEIRDVETAQIAVKASITGHLVLSTLHANSAPTTAVRLIHMGVPGYLVASSLKLIVAQRLIKRLCPSCKEERAPSEVELKPFSEAERSLLAKAWSARGCPACQRTGCAGRQALFEVMPVSSSAMKRLLLEGRSPEEIAAQAQAEGMSTLRSAALKLAAAGEASLAEATKICLGD